MNVIELQKVNKVYDMGAEVQVNALLDISLSIEKGEYVAIMGPSGSGKTTLMNILGCLDVPSDGTFLFRGHHVETLDRERRGWDLFYDTLDALEQALAGDDPRATDLVAATRRIVADASID